jgi:hypothetical protein
MSMGDVVWVLVGSLHALNATITALNNSAASLVFIISYQVIFMILINSL